MVVGDLGGRELAPVGDRGLEIPVPRCGSRITSTPSGASRRASSVSSGVDSESPVTSSVSSACFGGGVRADRRRVEGVRRHRRDPRRRRRSRGRRRRSRRRRARWSGESPPVSSCWASSSGRRSAIHSVGSPTASTMSWPIPGSISRGRVADRAAREQDQQHGDERDRADRVAGAVACAGRARSKRLISLSSSVLGQRPCPIRTGSR